MSAASIAALPAPLRPTDDDWAKMLAAYVHLGTKNLDNKMVRACASAIFLHGMRLSPEQRCGRLCRAGAADGGTDPAGRGRSPTSGSAALMVCT